MGWRENFARLVGMCTDTVHEADENQWGEVAERGALSCAGQRKED